MHAQSWTALFRAFSSHRQPSASPTKLFPSCCGFLLQNYEKQTEHNMSQLFSMLILFGQDSWPNWTNLKGLHSGRGFLGNKRFFTRGTSKNKWKNRWTLVVRTAIVYPYYKGSPCVTTEIITDKFDVLRGRLLGNHNDFGSRYDFPGVDHEGRQTCQ